MTTRQSEPVRVFLSGEGRTELGNAAADPPYRVPPEAGVLHALLDRAAPGTWSCQRAIAWKNIPKYRAGDHAAAETRTVIGLALAASEAGATVLAFVRDRDGDPARADDVMQGVRTARDRFKKVAIVGGIACECTESWILAAASKPVPNGSQRCKEAASAAGMADTEAKVQVIRSAELTTLREAGHGLGDWILQAEAVLSAESSR